MKKSVYLSLSVMLMVTMASPLLAESNSSLGNAGEIYDLRSGVYGELFPGRAALAPDTAVLSLEVTWPDGTLERHLLPQTEGTESDELVELVYEKKSGSLILVWTTRNAAGFDRLKLGIYHDQQFSEIFEIHSRPSNSPSVPLLARSKDTYNVELTEGEKLSTDRSIFHLVWQEWSETGWETFYTPIILVEGIFVGWSETFSLTSIYSSISTNQGAGANQGGGPQPPVSEALARALTVEASLDGRSIHTTFVHAPNRRLVTLHLGILPLELAILSDAVRDELLRRASEFDPENISGFADDMRAEIISMGATFGFHPMIVEYVGDEVSTWLVDIGGTYAPQQIDQLAEDLRNHTVDVTAALFGYDFGEASAGDGSQIIEIDIGDLLGEGEGPVAQPAQILDLRVVSDLPVPVTEPGPTAVYSSDDGRESIVAWLDSVRGKVFYVESLEDGSWSTPFEMKLGGRIDIEKADQLLRQRVR